MVYLDIFLISFQVLPLCQNQCAQIGYSFCYGTSPAPPMIPNVPDSPSHRSRYNSIDDDQDHGPVHSDPLCSTRLAPDPYSPQLPSGMIIPPSSSSYSLNSSQREYQAQFRY